MCIRDRFRTNLELFILNDNWIVDRTEFTINQKERDLALELVRKLECSKLSVFPYTVNIICQNALK